jgi:Flp pilus assembly protein TadD
MAALRRPRNGVEPRPRHSPGPRSFHRLACKQQLHGGWTAGPPRHRLRPLLGASAAPLERSEPDTLLHGSRRLKPESQSGDEERLEALLQQALRLTEEGEWHEAFRVLGLAEEEFPRDPTLLCMLGVASEEADAGGMAYEYFRRCLAEQPTDPAVLVSLGAGLARYDDPDAEGVLRLAALSAPGSAPARREYGAYLAREGHLEQALAELEAARALEPEDPRVARETAVALLLSSRAEAAAEELERAMGLGAEDGDLLLLHGLALLQAGRDEESAEVLFRAADELPEDGPALVISALACAAQEWWDHAWEILARAEAAAFPAGADLLREVEDALESGSEAAGELLAEQLGPSLLRERLLVRS